MFFRFTIFFLKYWDYLKVGKYFGCKCLRELKRLRPFEFPRGYTDWCNCVADHIPDISFYNQWSYHESVSVTAHLSEVSNIPLENFLFETWQILRGRRGDLEYLHDIWIPTLTMKEQGKKYCLLFKLSLLKEWRHPSIIILQVTRPEFTI